ncbi:MAG: beta-ketoacyl synthase N-terminal-like domain-containing protein [Candidatus Omnitrophota bacterium]
MTENKVCVVASDIVTSYGRGVDVCWQGLLSNRSSIRECHRFQAGGAFQSQNAALIPGLEVKQGESLVWQMLKPLLGDSLAQIPKDAALFLATTTGEIDHLETAVLENSSGAERSQPEFLLEKVRNLIGATGEGMIVSAACSSASVAIAQGAARIRSGKEECVLIVACDCVSEFVFAGFSSLMALDPESARPFDTSREGLSLGEGAGFILLMSQRRAEKEGRTILGEIVGWAVAGDANHMTGPVRDGSGLRRAIQEALAVAGVSRTEVGCISGHGTGTLYNDSMEMKAYQSVFTDHSVPLYSIKGAVGHTMGAAGLIETIVALQVLRERMIPPTVGTRNVDPEAEGWVSLEKRALKKNVVLVNNSGFGGINAALILRSCEE